MLGNRHYAARPENATHFPEHTYCVIHFTKHCDEEDEVDALVAERDLFSNAGTQSRVGIVRCAKR